MSLCYRYHIKPWWVTQHASRDVVMAEIGGFLEHVGMGTKRKSLGHIIRAAFADMRG